LEAEALCPLIPGGLELDLFDGQAYVGAVPFTNEGRVAAVWSKYSNLLKLQVTALPAPNGLLEDVTRQFWTL
jgi:hypothetical protein